MAYNKDEIFEKAKENNYTIVEGINFGLSYFQKEDRFESEKDFVRSFLLSINDTIKKIYNLDIENIELEKTFNLMDYDLPSQRVDIYCTTKQGIDLFIECKNPNNVNAELNNSIGQMLNYQVIIESLKRETKLIFATSIFNFYMLKVIKRFNLNYDIILHNKFNNAFILRSEL